MLLLRQGKPSLGEGEHVEPPAGEAEHLLRGPARLLFLLCVQAVTRGVPGWGVSSGSSAQCSVSGGGAWGA